MQRTIERYAMAAAGDHVLVGVSGGADSVATLAALAHLGPRLGLTISAAHVNHGLRGSEADRDAALAEAIATQLRVSFRLVRLSPGLARGGNTEERARTARYAALAELAAELRAAHIATGHTRDDQAETVLMRVVRGCGPSGLVGILPVRPDQRLIRPLLECTRRDVERFVGALALPYCTDSSNEDRRFLRNRIRHEVLPLLRQLNPQIDRALGDLAAISREREQLGLPSVGAGRHGPSIADLRAGAPAWRAEQVLRWLGTVRGSRRGLTKRHVVAVLGLLDEGRPNRRVELPGGTVLREYGRLRFVLGMVAQAAAMPQVLHSGESVQLCEWRIAAGPVETWVDQWRLPEDLWSAVVDADVMPSGLVVRNMVPGDRVRPYGMAGRRKLSDIFVDRRVPRVLRAGCPVVQAGPEILWVPGVVRSADALIGSQTRRVMWLRAASQWQPLLG